MISDGYNSLRRSRSRYSQGINSCLETSEQFIRLRIVFPQQPMCSKVRHTIAVFKIHALLILHSLGLGSSFGLVIYSVDD